MKMLAIIGAGYMAKIVAEESHRKGIRCCCFSDDVNSVAKDSVDEFFLISIFDKDEIVNACKRNNVNGVFATTELTIEIAAYVANKLGLVGNDVKIMHKITNKYYVRSKTANIKNLNSPKYILIDDIKKVPKIDDLPVIVKPTQLGGKRGITVVSEFNELENALKYAKSAIANRNQKIIIEEFLLGGKEYSVESLSNGGMHYIIQITEKISSGPPHCVELGHMQPANLTKKMQDMIKNVINNILESLHLMNGASHIELKVIDGKIYLIEVNFRPGGDHIAHPLTQLSTGFSYIGGAIDIALGCFNPINLHLKNNNYAGVLFVTRQTSYLKDIFDCCEKYPWLYIVNKVSEYLQDITHNDGFNTNYIMYCQKKEFPQELKEYINT